MTLPRRRRTSWIGTLAAISWLIAAPSTLSAQPWRHAEALVFASDIFMNPVYLRPILPLVEGVPVPTRIEPSLHLPAFGLGVSLYVHPGVAGIIQYSRTSNRSSDVSMSLPYRPVEVRSFQLLTGRRSTTHARWPGSE